MTDAVAYLLHQLIITLKFQKMIRIFITAVLYLISFFSQAQGNSIQESQLNTESNVTIKTIITEMNNDKGTVYFALFTSEEDFDNRNHSQARWVKANTNGVAVTFENVPEGTYAITCFYDENDNGKMDFNTNGMPIEDYGSSNNVMNLGPPMFSDAKFVVSDKDLTFEIKL